MIVVVVICIYIYIYIYECILLVQFVCHTTHAVFVIDVYSMLYIINYVLYGQTMK